jgi:hypothetical protein
MSVVISIVIFTNPKIMIPEVIVNSSILLNFALDIFSNRCIINIDAAMQQAGSIGIQ